MTIEKINKGIKNSIEVKESILKDQKIISLIDEVSKIIINAFKQKHKVFFCGNGGSASDAQHLSAEFTGRFYFDREPLDSEALHVNTAYLTAVANDYSYDEVYARLVKAKCSKGDVLVGLSTSGNSKNIIRAFEEARKLGVVTIAFTGKSGGAMKNIPDYLINVPSSDTPRIQEAHIMIGHIICEIVEEEIFGKLK
jgi:D-sedoheptulose 7-phosphate isomerase